jgi:murein L,D-transpeptidase YcbB/YkuD
MQYKYNYKIWLFLCITGLLAPAGAYSKTTDSDYTSPYYSDGTFFFAPSSSWLVGAAMHNNAKELLDAIRSSEKHGLNPSSYGLHSLAYAIDEYAIKREKLGIYDTEALQSQRKSLEHKLDTAFVRLARDLGRGVLVGKIVQEDLHRAAPKVDVKELISSLRTGKATVKQLLDDVTQQRPEYVALTTHMQTLLTERDSGAQRIKVQYVESAKFGDEHQAFRTLKHRLKQTGDLDQNKRINVVFDDDLKQALISVQERHGLKPNGLITEGVIVALNRSIDDDINEVAINLERWRWMPRDLGDRHIMVNIPAYELNLVNNNQTIAQMPVVVGSVENPTPIFSENASIVEVAPTWTVPASIANSELIPRERKNPGYLEREKMDFYKWDKGKLVKVDRSTVTRKEINTTPFPYVIRQRAGEHNALGMLKVLMPNKHAIYLHDTQSKNLFSKTDRAYSHGCIRLSDPFRLANLLLQLDGYSPTQTDKILASTDTHRVNLKNKTPTHLTYFTAWVDDKGRFHKRKDVYQHNERVRVALEFKNTLIANLDQRQQLLLSEFFY